MSNRSQDDVQELISAGQRAVEGWEGQWAAFEPDETLQIAPERAAAVITELGERLHDNYPFFHPSYAGQMLKPPHPVAAAAYAMAQRINPNAHALDGGPATAQMEHEVVAALARMLGYDPAASLGHLTSSGTIANLEALWVARELQPGKAIAYSAEAHYTHSRMCRVIAVEGIPIETDVSGRMDFGALEAALIRGNIGTIVATAGTTSLGAVDPIDAIIPLASKYGARVHVDAAYGGFFTLLASDLSPDLTGLPSGRLSVLPSQTADAFRSIAKADSIVVDPHKHGLQPYGCGSVLFKDASIGRFYQHDSPYTYFTSNELHLGEISLECSRAGAAAAALWATLQVFPLELASGFGPILVKSRAAAQRWAELIRESDRLELVVEPELDIVCFYPLPPESDRRTSSISATTSRIFTDLTNDPVDPLYVATLQVKPALLAGRNLVWDTDQLTALRSVLMKPEHLEMVGRLHERVLAANMMIS